MFAYPLFGTGRIGWDRSGDNTPVAISLDIQTQFFVYLNHFTRGTLVKTKILSIFWKERFAERFRCMIVGLSRGNIFVALVVAVSSISLLNAQAGIEIKQTPKTLDNAPNKIALVVGNGAYKVSRLKNPANDAAAVAQTLRDLGFKVDERKDLELNGMKASIEGFGRSIKDASIALFYYAGHGVQVNGHNYLIPIDADIESEQEVEYKSVNAGLVLAKMAGARSTTNIVILDACRDNPFARSFRSLNRGLASMDAPNGTFVAYATAPGSLASDGAGENGLYTSALVRIMKEPGLKIEDVFKQVRTFVRMKTRGRQVPWESSSLEGDFYFNPGTTIPASSAPTDVTLSVPPEKAVNVPEKRTIRDAGQVAVGEAAERSPGKPSVADDLVRELASLYRAGRLGTQKKTADDWSSKPITMVFMDVQVEGLDGTRTVNILSMKVAQELKGEGRVQMVERDLLDKLLAELKLSASSLADRETSLKLGKLLSARIMVTGNIYPEKEGMGIALRFVDTETTAVRHVLTVECPSREADRRTVSVLAKSINDWIRSDFPLRGRIKLVADGTCLINLGQMHGIKKGDRLEIIREIKKGSGRFAVTGEIEVIEIERSQCQSRILSGEKSIREDTQVRVKM